MSWVSEKMPTSQPRSVGVRRNGSDFAYTGRTGITMPKPIIVMKTVRKMVQRGERRESFMRGGFRRRKGGNVPKARAFHNAAIAPCCRLRLCDAGRVKALLLNGARATAATALLLLSAAPGHADWLQYRGPTQNGATGEQPLNPQALSSPKTLWKLEIGKGTSSVTASGGHVFTMGNVDAKDVVYCLEAATGKEVWRYVYPMSVDPKLFEGGPRSTPVVDEGHVYALSHEGDLFCLDAATGKKVWTVNYQKDLGGKRPDWGYAGSPLIKGKAVYCDVGGPGASTVALEKASGKVLWKAGNDMGAYATPVLATLGGRETLVMFKAENVVGLDPANGTEYWRTPWKTSYDINAATPVVIGKDRLFVASGYNTGCALFQVSGKGVTQLWKNKSLRTQLNTAAPSGEFIYGIDGDVGGGHLVCVSLADGTSRWQEKSVRGGALVLSGGKLVILSERGELVVCEASPDSFKPLGRAQVLSKRCWAQPTLDAGRLFLRSNEGEIVCLEAK